MKPVVGAIHELPLPQVLEIETIAHHTCIQQRQKIIVEGNSAYIPIGELHGVLLTTSREKAKAIVNSYEDLVKPYLVMDKVLFQKYGIQSAIHPVGVYNLLKQLAMDRPSRAT
jgi:hypothetical protein